MNIIYVKSIPGQKNYLLKENEKTVLKFNYKPESHIARVETEFERRVLIIDDEGLLKSRFILKNEYGIKIGQMIFDSFSNYSGTVEIEDTRYRFNLQHTSTYELSLYKNSRKNLVYRCLLSFDEKNDDPAGDNRIFKTQTSSLIIAVAWYLVLKKAEKQTPEFSV